MNRARIHEHTGKVAIRLSDNETIYLDTDFVRKLSDKLKEAATQIEQGYHYETTTIKES